MKGSSSRNRSFRIISRKYNIDFQDISYYSAPKGSSSKKKSLDEVDQEVLKTFERLGIPLNEQKLV